MGLQVKPVWTCAAPWPMVPSGVAKRGNATAAATAPYTKNQGVNLLAFSTVPSPGTWCL